MKLTDVEKQLTRLRRADDLGIEISEKIQLWSKNNLDSKIVISDDRKSWYLELIVKQSPPYDEWSMLFSDSIGQLRSTLDNLVYSTLTPLANQSELPNDKLIKFPISKTAADWKSASKGIKHIPEPYFSRIKEFQPFALKSAPGELNGLEVLQRLSNGDKHNLQIVPSINIADFEHNFTIEYETLEDAGASVPPNVETLKPVFINGSLLVRQTGKERIQSVKGEIRVQSQVVVDIGYFEVGITKILSELWNHVVNILIHVTEIPRKDFEDWAKTL